MDINFNTNNKWVETGEPVTVSDVLMFEDNLRQTAEDKYLTNEAKKDLSQTQAAHALRQEWIHKVQDEIDALMEFERNKDEGTTKKTWFEQFEKINNTHKLADAAISVTFDATQREWSETSARIHMGRLVGTLVFQAVMNHNAGARRRLKRLEQKAAQVKGFDGVGRAERILEYAKEYGFDSDRWVNDVAYMSKHGAVLIATVLKALPEQFFREKSKRGKDSNLTWYINLKEQTTEELETLRNAALDTLTSYYGPMICPPRKWSKDNMGPYIRQERGWLVPLVRNASKEQASDIVQALRSNQFEVVLDALNAIQETPYSVNRYVVEAIDWVKSHMDPMTGENLIGRAIKGFPNTKTQKLDPSQIISKDEFKKLPIKKQIILGKKRATLLSHNQSAKGARELCERMLGKAKTMSQFEKFWLPHNFDYRGRVYHIPDFGHHNIDFVRAIFEFANKKPITDDNDVFLMLQLANTAGQDKKTLKKRLEWVVENKDAIIAAGKDFKTTYDFWGSQSKNSFQFLAACRDWALYKDAKANGQTYYSGLPVAMDATQSGVQHFAAAGRNKDEGAKVNLLPSDEPSDFYKLCLDRAINLIKANLESSKAEIEANPLNDKDRKTIEANDAIQNDIGLNEYSDLSDEERDEQHAKDKKKAYNKFKRTAAYRKLKLLKDIDAATVALELYEKKEYTRDHIKRNAMVFCYSSEEYGMSNQLQKDWMDALSEQVFDGKLEAHPFGEDDGFHAATYLANIHYQAISEEVTSAATAMKFFQDVAEILANENIHVKFTNTLNFPFHQNYRVAERRIHQVVGMDTQTLEYNREARMRYNYYTDKINVEKTTHGIAPNLIHQQDSLHLMMTVLSCVDHGVTDFMLIHDSYATTAADAKTLAAITREQFVDLYGEYDFYVDFLEQSKERYENTLNTRRSEILEQLKAKPEDTKLKEALDKVTESINDIPNIIWPELPKLGDLDLSQVINSDYFFS